MLRILGMSSPTAVPSSSSSSSSYVGFDDVLYLLRKLRPTAAATVGLLISTLSAGEQDYLIQHTLSYQMEEKTVNDLLQNYAALSRTIVVVYGRNGADATVEFKYKQLVSLGFARVYMYMGGLLEWWMLQEIYGAENFPSQGTPRDLLHYAAPAVLRLNPDAPSTGGGLTW